MWTRRIILLVALAFIAHVTWQVGVLLGRRDMLWGVLFGVLPGVGMAALLLWLPRRSNGGANHV